MADDHQPDVPARFEAFARAAAPSLARYLRRRADADTAEDVLADTLLVMWRRFHEIEALPGGTRLPWCYGAARGCLANARRTERRRRGLLLRLATQPDNHAWAGGSCLDEPAVDGALEDALAGLRESDREVLRLWAWEGLQPRELAVALGISPNAAALRLHRATRRLRERLRPPGSGKNPSRAGLLNGRQGTEEQT